MDYITNVDSNKYVISLDSLDMGLLPTYTARPVNSASLWTANLNIGTKDYFEFHIKSKTETNAFDDDDPTSNDESTNSMNESQSNLSKSTHRDETTTICHICDIDIPAAYFTEHENSLKHKANLKITDTVLSRTRKHILKKGNGYVRKNYSTYFCGPCVSEVKLDDKHTHEDSIAHRRSASLDRLLFELVTLYTIHTYEAFQNIEESETMNDENIIQNEFDCEIEDNTVIISDGKARLEEFEAKTMIDYTQLPHEFGLETLFTLSNVGNDIKISRVNGCEVIVSEDNFNGFIQVGKDQKFCILCKINVEEEKVHKLSDAHLKSITEPFNDDNFIRNLGNSRSHCVICNKIVNDANFHITCDKTHKDLRQGLVFNDNKAKDVLKDPIININDQDLHPDTGIINNVLDIGLDNRYRLLQPIIAPLSKPNVTPKSDTYTKIDNDTYLCNPCNLELHVNNIESHEIGTKHAMNLKSAVHYNMVRNVGSGLTCRVCNSNVADNVDKVKAHVATNDHLRKYIDLLAKNRVIVKEGKFYCEPCDLVILKRNEIFHIEKLTHEAKLFSFQETKIKLNSTQNTNTSKADSNVLLHAVDNNSDKNNVSTTYQPISNNSKRTDTTAYYCDVCKVKVPNNLNNIRSHNEGGRHKKNASQLLNTVEEVADSIDDSESLQVHCHMDATDNEKCLMCKVCKVLVPNMEDSINEHVKGKKHDAAFKVIMDSNYVESVDDKYFCKLCKVDIKPHNTFKHINQKKHVALVVKIMNPETAKPEGTFDSDAKDIVAGEISVPLSKESVDVLYQKFKHNFVESEDKKSLKCRICSNVDIPNIAKNVVNHTKLKAHREGYKNLLSSNLIFQTEDSRYFCAICDCYLPRTGEINHARGNRHTENFEGVVSKEKCIVCDVDMIDTNMSEHITTREHIYNVLCNEPLLHFCKYCKLLIKKDFEVQHRNNCHRFAVRDKVCFCAECHPCLPKTSSS